MPRQNAFIPFGSASAAANNSTPLPTQDDPGSFPIDPPQLINQPYQPYQVQGMTPVPYGPQVETPTNGTLPNYPVASYPSPTVGTPGFGAPNGTYDTGGYTDPSGVYWPNTTTTDAPSFGSRLLPTLGRIALQAGGGILGGPLGSIAGKLAGKLIPNAPDRVTYQPGGPLYRQGASYNPLPGGTYDARGGYQEPGASGRYWPKTTVTETGAIPASFDLSSGRFGPSGQNYGQSMQQADLALMSQQAAGGQAGGPRGVSDEGHTVFSAGQHKRMLNEDGDLVPTNEIIRNQVFGASGLFRNQPQSLQGLASYAPTGASGQTPVSDATARFLASLAAQGKR